MELREQQPVNPLGPHSSMESTPGSSPGWSPPSFPSPLLPSHLSLQFSQRFQPYVLYCLRVKQTMAYAREQQDNNPLFHTFVQVREGLSGDWEAGDPGPKLSAPPGWSRSILQPPDPLPPSPAVV